MLGEGVLPAKTKITAGTVRTKPTGPLSDGCSTGKRLVLQESAFKHKKSITNANMKAAPSAKTHRQKACSA